MALLVAVGLTALIASTTNTSEVSEFTDLYTVIAEHGLSPHPQLVSPCAYRFVSPMLAGAATKVFGLSIPQGFFVVSMAASVGLLWLSWRLAMRLGGSHVGGLVIMAVIALSIGHLKNNLYFNNSMEAVAQILMIAWCLAMFAERWWTAIALCVVGLCTREVFLIPTALTCGELLFCWRRTGERSDSLRFLACCAATAAAFALPRMLIPVAATIQLIDPVNDDNWLVKLFDVPLNWRRDVNILAAAANYSLPVLLLMTRQRLRFAIDALRPYRRGAAAYCGLLLLLTLYGGTDLYRYATYLFLPLIFTMSALFHKSATAPRLAEVALALAATAVHNQAFAQIPSMTVDLERYLDFWPAYEDRLNGPAAMRMLQIVAFVSAAGVFRWVLDRRQAAPAAPPEPLVISARWHCSSAGGSLDSPRAEARRPAPVSEQTADC